MPVEAKPLFRPDVLRHDVLNCAQKLLDRVSITDLEKLRNEILLPSPSGRRAGGEGRREPKKSRRRKEGAFYTPAFITRCIIEQASGRVIA